MPTFGHPVPKSSFPREIPDTVLCVRPACQFSQFSTGDMKRVLALLTGRDTQPLISTPSLHICLPGQVLIPQIVNDVAHIILTLVVKRNRKMRHIFLVTSIAWRDWVYTQIRDLRVKYSSFLPWYAWSFHRLRMIGLHTLELCNVDNRTATMVLSTSLPALTNLVLRGVEIGASWPNLEAMKNLRQLKLTASYVSMWDMAEVAPKLERFSCECFESASGHVHYGPSFLIPRLKNVNTLRHLKYICNAYVYGDVFDAEGMTTLRSLKLSGNTLSSIKNLHTLTLLENLAFRGELLNTPRLPPNLRLLRYWNMDDSWSVPISATWIPHLLRELDLVEVEPCDEFWEQFGNFTVLETFAFRLHHSRLYNRQPLEFFECCRSLRSLYLCPVYSKDSEGVRALTFLDDLILEGLTNGWDYTADMCALQDADVTVTIVHN